MRTSCLFLILCLAGAAAAQQSPPPAPQLTPEQMQALPKKLQVKPPPYFFKKDGTPYRPTVLNAKVANKVDMLRARKVATQLVAQQRPVVPPLHGSFGDWVSFMHEVIHR